MIVIVTYLPFCNTYLRLLGYLRLTRFSFQRRLAPFVQGWRLSLVLWPSWRSLIILFYHIVYILCDQSCQFRSTYQLSSVTVKQVKCVKWPCNERTLWLCVRAELTEQHCGHGHVGTENSKSYNKFQKLAFCACYFIENAILCRSKRSFCWGIPELG